MSAPSALPFAVSVAHPVQKTRAMPANHKVVGIAIAGLLLMAVVGLLALSASGTIGNAPTPALSMIPAPYTQVSQPTQGWRVSHVLKGHSAIYEGMSMFEITVTGGKMGNNQKLALIFVGCGNPRAIRTIANTDMIAGVYRLPLNLDEGRYTLLLNDIKTGESVAPPTELVATKNTN